MLNPGHSSIARLCTRCIILSQFSLQEDMGLGENLDDAVGGRTGRAGRKTRLKRQRRLPLQLVLFEEDKQTRLLE